MTGIAYSMRVGAGDAPAWAAALTSRTWTQLSSTNFKTWATANMPSGSYLGSKPIVGIADAYCDPSYDASNHKAYFYGGGHTDSTCNAVIEFDLATLGYRLASNPTPPSKYPPNYVSGSGVTYPSGHTTPGNPSGSWFDDSLTDPLDTPYNAPQKARASSHMYGAAAVRGSKTHYFYQLYGEVDNSTGAWSQLGSVDIGAQLFAQNSNYTNLALEQGTMAVYDSVTDKFYVTAVPGDDGINWRTFFFPFDPTTRTIGTAIGAAAGYDTQSAMNFLIAGRYIYAFLKSGGGTPNMDFGYRWNMDTHVFQYLTLTGDSCVPGTTNQETVVPFYDAANNMIWRWNFKTADIAYLYGIDLSTIGTTGGSGTSGSPYNVTQTKTLISGTPPTRGWLNYKRMFIVPEWGNVMAFLPEADSNWFAIKM